MPGLAHLIPRGLAVATDHIHQVDDSKAIKLSPAGIAAIATTIILFSLWWYTIRYTYLAVVGTLTSIESPQTEIYLDAALTEQPDKSDKLGEPEIMTVKVKPITAKIRTTIRHLRSVAGYWSRFRGMSIYLIYHFALSTIVHSFGFSKFGHSLPGRTINHALAELFLCQLEVAWVHIVISEPSKMRWYKRVPTGLKSYRKILPAAALKVVGSTIPFILPTVYACNSHLARPHTEPFAAISEADIKGIVIDSLLVIFMYVTLVVLIEVPATVTFIRVAASMLPEQDETVVPFDRTFNGKVTPEILGGSGKVGIVEAWRSFEKASRIRLLKLIFKVFMIHVTLMAACGGLLYGELRFFAGDQFDKLVAAARAGRH